MPVNRLAAVALVMGAAALSGCNTASKALGMSKVTPDEFRVVTQAPLVVPPDFSLRPPAPGEPRPQELQPESAARVALLGQREAEARSEGEKMLVTRAGADKADPLIRYVVDDEFGAVAHKDKGFADWVMFWRHGKAAAEPTEAAVAANTSTPVNPAAEATRIQSLTGNQQVVIARRSSGKIKLPGL
ncbi:MAG TPA: DUF3035 domain-containing protein [Caulobacteraceae bacterium]|nr:DUF3035 domain-containing protein [Caulobacteraceae bacterium]